MDASQIENQPPLNQMEDAPEEKMVTRQQPNNPLFTFDEDDSPVRSDRSDDDVGSYPAMEAERRTKKRSQKPSNISKATELRARDLVLKTKNKLMGAVNLAREVGIDQVHFETLNLDHEGAGHQFMETEAGEAIPKFDKFLAKKPEEPLPVPVAPLQTTLLEKLAEIDASDSDEVELQIAEPVYRSQSEALIQNTVKIRTMVEAENPEGIPLVFPKKEKTNTLAAHSIRTREDLVKVYNQSLEERRKGNICDPERLQQVFKTVTYQELDEQRRLKRQQAEAERQVSHQDDLSYDSEENVLEKEGEDSGQEADRVSKAPLSEVAGDARPVSQAPSVRNPSDNHSVYSKAPSRSVSGAHHADKESEKSEEYDDEGDEGNEMHNAMADMAEQWLFEGNQDTERQARKEEIARVAAQMKKDVTANGVVPAQDPSPGTKGRLRSLATHQETLREQKRREIERRRLREKARKRRVNREFFEEEAELGSDDEMHGDIVKKIDANADSEQEDDAMDQSDEELIDREELELDPENELRAEQKYLEDMIEADEAELRQIEEGIYFQKAQRNASLAANRREEIQERGQRLRNMLSWLEGRGPNAQDATNLTKGLTQPKNASGLNVFDDEQPVSGQKEVTFSAAEFLKEMEELKKLRERENKEKKNAVFQVKEKSLSVLPMMAGKKIQFAQVGYQKLIGTAQGSGPARPFYAAKEKDLERQKFEDE